jgi:tetratricopeptide (TPR) repeat protein|tara:strand:+ start:3386 stop:3817 length:432 start_codon:yes stop_codon:yes gene_type:complete
MADDLNLLTLDRTTAMKAREICQQGYLLFDNGNFKSAIRQFYSAWTLLPKPQTQWEEAGWILTALGDAYFNKGDFDNGREALRSALHCPKASGNPFIHLRLGQCLFELGELGLARTHFQKVKDRGGAELLAKEHHKYKEFSPS